MSSYKKRVAFGTDPRPTEPGHGILPDTRLFTGGDKSR